MAEWQTEYSDRQSTVTDIVQYQTEYSDRQSALTDRVHWQTEYIDRQSALTDRVHWQTDYSDRQRLGYNCTWSLSGAWSNRVSKASRSHLIPISWTKYHIKNTLYNIYMQSIDFLGEYSTFFIFNLISLGQGKFQRAQLPYSWRWAPPRWPCEWGRPPSSSRSPHPPPRSPANGLGPYSLV